MWVPITKEDLLAVMTADEIELIGQQMTTVDLDDRVPMLLAQTVAKVRGYIAACEQNQLIPADASLIPIAFVSDALAMARWSLLTVLPNYDPGEARKEANAEALKFFDKVASCKVRPQPPQSEVATMPINQLAPTMSTPHDAEVIGDVPSRTGRNRMNGL